MSGFIHSMVTRHLGNENKILPRLREKFEPFTNAPVKQDNGLNELTTETEPKLHFQESNLNQSVAPVFPSQVNPASRFDSTDKNNSYEFRYRSANLPPELSPDLRNRMPEIDPEKLSAPEEKNIIDKADSLLSGHLNGTPYRNDGSAFAALPEKKEFNSGTEYEKPLFSGGYEIDPAGADRKFPNRQMRDDLSWLKEFRKVYDGIKTEENAGTESRSIVRVNIGRIDVRAVTKQSAPPPEPVQKKPGLSLEEFLNKKNGLRS